MTKQFKNYQLNVYSVIEEDRLSLTNSAIKYLGFSKMDKDAEITYREFFGDDEVKP